MSPISTPAPAFAVTNTLAHPQRGGGATPLLRHNLPNVTAASPPLPPTATLAASLSGQNRILVSAKMSASDPTATPMVPITHPNTPHACAAAPPPHPAAMDCAAEQSTPKPNVQFPKSVTAYGTTQKLRLVTGAVAIPHPDKVAKGGEDAFFVSPVALGVFDGVGGWASIGVDPGLYSKQLAAKTARYLDERGPHTALESLVLAVEDNSAIGSSTACVVGLVQEHHDPPPVCSPDKDSQESSQTRGGLGQPYSTTETRPHTSAPLPVPDAAEKSQRSRDLFPSDLFPSSSSSSSSSSLSCSSSPFAVGLAELQEDFPDAAQDSYGGSLSESDDPSDADAALGSSSSSDDSSVDEDSATSGTYREREEFCPPRARLKGVNLGDSGLIVIRNGFIVYATKEQQHYFNCPFQVGSGVGSDSVDSPHMGDSVDFVVYPGDCIVLATDGLWDNVFPDEILSTVATVSEENDGSSSELDRTVSRTTVSSSSSSMSCSSKRAAVSTPEALKPMSSSESLPEPQPVAQALADFALRVAGDDRRQSPFAVNAKEAGLFFRGGKMDDITVVTAYVKAVEQASAPSPTVMPSSPITPTMSPSSSRSSHRSILRDQPVDMDLDVQQKI